MADKMRGVLEEQKAYYEARAREYDEWFYRQGRYDHGPEQSRQWRAEAEKVRQALLDFNLTGHVLDVAAGTGIWTQELVKTADHVTVIDSAEEMMAINRLKVQSDQVTYTLADLFYWQPVLTYDGIFMGFWPSHVPPALLYDFIGTIAGALKSGGKVFIVDSLAAPSATAKDLAEEIRTRQQAAQSSANDLDTIPRRLNDGREYQIFKIFYKPEDLALRFEDHDIRMTIKQTENYFLFGWGTMA
jgi:ubiquinone/menaquinone biosynthesis C-methylase UbiE